MVRCRSESYSGKKICWEKSLEGSSPFTCMTYLHLTTKMKTKISPEAVQTFNDLLEQVGHDLSDCNTGICINCGASTENVEPDATEYTCDVCGFDTIYGAEEFAMMYLS